MKSKSARRREEGNEGARVALIFRPPHLLLQVFITKYEIFIVF